MQLSLVPLVGGVLSLGKIRGGCILGRSLGSLFADGWGMNPLRLLFGLGLLSPDVLGQIFSKMTTSRGVHAVDYS